LRGGLESINTKIRKHFEKVDPVIYKAMEGLDFDEWIKPYKERKKANDYFAALCVEIIGQQLSRASANAIIKRFRSLFKDEKIDPKQLLAINDQRLRDAGMSWAKAKYVKNIAEAYLNKTVRFDELDNMSDEEVIKELNLIKGVGPWTAEMFLMFHLNRPDVFSHGDLGLKKGMMKLYKKDFISKEFAEEVTSKWMPWRTYGSIALWHSLEV